MDPRRVRCREEPNKAQNMHRGSRLLLVSLTTQRGPKAGPSCAGACRTWLLVGRPAFFRERDIVLYYIMQYYPIFQLL